MKKSKSRQSGISNAKNFSSMVKNTKRNKIKSITKALKTAGGEMINKLEERLKFWEGK